MCVPTRIVGALFQLRLPCDWQDELHIRPPRCRLRADAARCVACQIVQERALSEASERRIHRCIGIVPHLIVLCDRHLCGARERPRRRNRRRWWRQWRRSKHIDHLVAQLVGDAAGIIAIANDLRANEDDELGALG